MLERAGFVVSLVGFPLLSALRARTYHATLSRVVGALLREHPPRPMAPSIEQYAATITATLRERLAARGISTAGVRLQAEPGRGLYGDAGLHLTRVTKVKRQTEPVPLARVLTGSRMEGQSG